MEGARQAARNPSRPIGPDHVRVAGETVLISDPEGCSKLEAILAEWLVLEKKSLELARKEVHPKSAAAAEEAARQPEQRALHYQVEVDQRGQVHIHCLQGKEVVISIGLNLPGFNSLFNQGLMRKPHALTAGVLHDWVELDGVLCSFEKGNNDAAKLEKLLNEHYLPASSLGQGKSVVVFANPASSTGFDIQFPITVAGVRDNRRRHLNEEALEVLQDPIRCGLLHKGIILRLTRPTLIFKQKTPDGGERYMESGAPTTVRVTSEEGEERFIDLSQPVNYLHLSAVELTAVFNHPAVNCHSQAAAASPPGEGQKRFEPPQPVIAVVAAVPPAVEPGVPPGGKEAGMAATALNSDPGPGGKGPPAAGESLANPVSPASPHPKTELPNLWLKAVLVQAPMPHDWFASLVYGKLAEQFDNSHQGWFGPSPCWTVAMGEVEDIAEAGFKGVFLTEKRWFGFRNQGRMVRFHSGVVFVGGKDSAIEGINVGLLAVGLDGQQRVVFVVTDSYRARFGVPEQTVGQELARLRESGAVMMSVKEVLESCEPLEVVWTVPAAQADPNEPQALESLRQEQPRALAA
jgi:hypothetical protein